MALTNKLKAIADAIREKTYTTELMSLDEMPEAITNIQSGGYAPTAEQLTLTGDQEKTFYENKLNWILEKYGNRITTVDITNCDNMFRNNDITEIPFTINIKDVGNGSNVFDNCNKLKVSPKIRGTFTRPDLTYTVRECHNLRDIEDLFLPEMFDVFAEILPKDNSTFPKYPKFQNMYSLRQLPSWFSKFKLNPNCTTGLTTGSSMLYYALFGSCYTLDEILNIPVWTWTNLSVNGFNFSSFYYCYRVKDITFETNADGSPMTANWRAQTIDLTLDVGYGGGGGTSLFTKYNSGITADKFVDSDTKYESLKNDPDWFTGNPDYSRYNKTSAINTINSLPDTSAYLAKAGGTNTIKFTGAAGSSTDGGAINTLTEAEIAVATSKGWTVSLS